MCFVREEKSSAMSGKVLISITVLAVFVLVSGFTLKAKREGKIIVSFSSRNFSPHCEKLSTGIQGKTSFHYNGS